MAAGMALLMPPLTNAIVTSLPQDKAGVASAVNDTTREVGGAVGIALMGTLLSTGYQSALGGATAALPETQAELAQDSVGGAMVVASQLQGPAAGELVAAARQAFVDGSTIAFGAAGALGVIMAILIARTYPDDVAVDQPLETLTV